nr:RHS repeat-associated core domain-containing protein [Kineosporia babensis]
MDGDPTPGDPANVETLAGRFLDFADTAERCYRQVTSMAGDSAVMTWVGQSGDAFRNQFGEFPEQLRKLYTSHEMCGEALTRFAPVLEQAQGQADRALADGREARASLSSATAALAAATDDAGAASKNADKLQNPEKDAPEPDKDQVAQAVRDAQAAQQRQSDAQGAVGAAQSALDAAKRMAEQARQLREGAAKEAVRAIDEASDAGIRPRSFWEKLADFFKGLWEIICKIAEVLAIVFGVLAIIFGGPFAWIALIAGAILLVKAIVDFAQGKGNIMDLVFGLLGVIPGIKGLTTIGKVSALFKQGGLKAIGKAALTGAKDILKNLVANIKSLGAGLKDIVKKGLGGPIGKINTVPKITSKDIKGIPACGDPVDVATGRMFIDQSDLHLPGRLPLHLHRAHLSDHRFGRAFGPTWASWLDQRLIVQGDTVHLISAAGMILSYAMPGETGRELPVHGAAAPLRRTEEGFAIDNPDGAGSLFFGAADEEGEAPLLAVAGRHGQRIEVDRDEFDRITLIRHSGGYRVGVEHNEAGLVCALRMLPRADAPTDVHGDRPLLVRTFAYDERRRLTAIGDSEGRLLHYDYDDQGRIVRWRDRNDMWFRYEYDDQNRCVRTEGKDGYLSYGYDYAPGATKVTDSLGNVTTFTLNDELQLVAQTDPLGGTVRSEWDVQHNLLSRTDALGGTTRFSHDANGDVVAIESADGRRMTFEHSAPGQVSQVTQPDGAVWRREYDENGRVVSESTPSGMGYGYDYEGSGELAENVSESAEWDAAGLPTLVSNAQGQTLRFVRDRFGRTTEEIDDQGNRTTYRYTVDGELTEMVDPTGLIQRWVYDGEGNPVSYTDGAGRTTTHSYTGFDLLEETVEPDGARTRYRHDTELRLIEWTNPEGRSWRFEYDAAGRRIAETDFDDRRTEYRHDAAGNLIGERDPSGEVTDYAWDARGNLAARRNSAGETRYRYDAMGRMVQVIGTHAKVTLERDAMGRVIAETVNDRTVHTSYDENGRVVGRLTPAGGAAVWEYDVVGRPIMLHTARHRLDIGYDSNGYEAFRRLDNRVFSAHTADAMGRSLDRLVLSGDVTNPASMKPVYWQRTAYGPDSDPVQVSDPNGERQIELDLTGRVLAVRTEEGTAVETYAYNGNGDVVNADWAGAGAVGGAREYSGSRVVRAGQTWYDYDANGRTVSRERSSAEGQRYTWNADGRLTGVTTSDGQRWRYVYDPLGRRIAKDRLEPAGQRDRVVERTEYIWSGAMLVEEIRTDRAGRSDARTWHGLSVANGPVAQYEQHADREVVLGQSLTMVVNDVIGNPVALVDTAGEVRWQRRGTIWGRDAEGTEHGSGNGIPIRMPGQYLDPETGFHYNNQRYYDPETGRYLSPDPLGLAPAPNPVAYVRNPMVWIDPLGLAGKACKRKRVEPENYREAWDQFSTPAAAKNPDDLSEAAKLLGQRDMTYGGKFPDSKGYVQAVGPHKNVKEFSLDKNWESEHVMPMKATELGGWRGKNRDGEDDEIAMSIPYGAHRAGQDGMGLGITSTGSGETASQWAKWLGDKIKAGDSYGAYKEVVNDAMAVDKRAAGGLMHYLDDIGKHYPERLNQSQVDSLKAHVEYTYKNVHFFRDFGDHSASDAAGERLYKKLKREAAKEAAAADS